MSETKWVRADGLDSIKYINPKKLAEEGFIGTVVEGRFLGPIATPFVDSNGNQKSDYKIEGRDGSIYVLNNSSSLTRQMAAVEPGEILQVNYLGTKLIESGKMKGNKSHRYEVLKESEELDSIA